MTRRSISQQLEILRKATANAASSPQAAADFLKRAGLVAPKKTKKVQRSGKTAVRVVFSDLVHTSAEPNIKTGESVIVHVKASTGLGQKPAGAKRRAVKCGVEKPAAARTKKSK